jgi:stearoyl-CoA desaturase (delta-9 desaturase)
MFGVTGGYHRYFSHRTYKTSRAFQFCLAWLGASSAQMGPLWWAAHHRNHHRYSDTDKDLHTPSVQGFWWSHMGWILAKKNAMTNFAAVRDLARFPELRFLNKFYMLPPILLAVGLAFWGLFLDFHFPHLNTSPLQMVVWGFFVSTVGLYHCTFSINSLAHTIGRRRFATKDSSRNSFILALIAMGEGWHNNHHRYPASERQGFYWWEIDLTHYLLKFLSWFHLVWDLREPPKEVYVEARQIRLIETGIDNRENAG